MDLAVGNEKEEAAAVLRAHCALHSLLFAAEKGMTDTDEVAAGIVAGRTLMLKEVLARWSRLSWRQRRILGLAGQARLSVVLPNKCLVGKRLFYC